jgi:tetratricopeptide (TPR) repeat protein
LFDNRFEEAIHTLDQEISDSIQTQFFYKPKSLYYAEVYRITNTPALVQQYSDSARIHLEAKIAVAPKDSRYHSSLGIAYAGLGMKKEAIEQGLTAVSLMPIEKDLYRGIFILEDLARIFTMVGEYNLALEQIDQLLSMPSLMSVNLLSKDPIWEPLWELPDFKKLLDKHMDN